MSSRQHNPKQSRLEALGRKVSQRIRRTLQRSISFLGIPRYIVHEGAILPPRWRRFCGKEYQDDRYYLESAVREVDRLRNAFGLTQGTRIIDIGCGVGRLATGILQHIGDIEDYQGVDVDAEAIAWCRRYISRRHPSFRFFHLDIENARYNPQGRPIDADFRFQFNAGRFDIAYAYSVFSHLTPDDAIAYLREFRRLLGRSGHGFLTAFVEEHVPDVTLNPARYHLNWSGPLHCVRYRRGFFEDLVAQADLTIDRYEYGREADGQSAVYLSPKV